MSDDLNMMPELTRDPTGAAAAAAEAPKAPEAPSLTLNNAITPDDAAAVKAAQEAQSIQLDESQLTEAERKMVDDFAAQIDITNTQMVMQYGAGSQKKIADFSESALNTVRTKDMGEIGQMLTDVVAELRDFEEEEEKGPCISLLLAKPHLIHV